MALPSQSIIGAGKDKIANIAIVMSMDIVKLFLAKNQLKRQSVS